MTCGLAMSGLRSGYLGQETPLPEERECSSGPGTGRVCRQPWARCYLRTPLSKGAKPAHKINTHTDFSRQCSRRIKRQEHRWCVVMWIFPQLWEEIRSCVPVTATGSSPSQSTSIQKKILLSNEKINLNMCIRHLCFVTCAIFLYFH